MMNRPSYKHAVEWLALNDDTEWVEYPPETGSGSLAVTAALVIDLFGVAEEKLRKDLHAELLKVRTQVERAPPTDGKPTWHGKFYHGGRWETVRNAAHNPLAYASDTAALAGAKLILGKRYEAALQQNAEAA